MPRGKVLVVIPARYGSTRFRGKPLAVIRGVPMIVRTLKRAQRIKSADRVVVATDDRRIEQIVTDAGGTAVMTFSKHSSGTSRVAEAVSKLKPRCSIVVNIQGDEPVFPVRPVERLIELMLEDSRIPMATLATKRITEAELFSRDVVKVVADLNGFALYFSRSPIPYPGAQQGLSAGGIEKVQRGASASGKVQHGASASGKVQHGASASGKVGALTGEPQNIKGCLKHIGIYAFRRTFLEEFVSLRSSPLEKRESLEQLRALENGYRIRVLTCSADSFSVDRPEDIKIVEKNIQTR